MTQAADAGPRWTLDTLYPHASLDEYRQHLWLCGRLCHMSMLNVHRSMVSGLGMFGYASRSERAAGWRQKGRGPELDPEDDRFDEAKARVGRILANRYSRWSSYGLDPVGSWGGGYGSDHRVDFDAKHDVRNLIQHAESEGVAVTWMPMRDSTGGFVYRRRTRHALPRAKSLAPDLIDPRDLQTIALGDIAIAINPRASWTTTFEVLIHELAHLLLGHVGPMTGTRRGRLEISKGSKVDWRTAEFEAISVSYLVAVARGAPDSDNIAGRLRPYHAILLESEHMASVSLLEIFAAAEVLAAWCASGLDGTRVLKPTGDWDPDGRAITGWGN